MKLQRIGGFAAIAAVFVSVVYLAFNISVQRRLGDLTDLKAIMAAALSTPGSFHVLNLLTIVCYTLLLIMFFAVHARIQADVPHLARIMLIAASAGSVMQITERLIYYQSFQTIIPVQDLSAYRACMTTAYGIGYMGSQAYGWACLLLGCSILKTRTFSPILGWLVSLTGIITIPVFLLPQLGDIIHLLAIASALWIGIALLKQAIQPTSKAMTAP